jgi:hypothetical protein
MTLLVLAVFGALAYGTAVVTVTEWLVNRKN